MRTDFLPLAAVYTLVILGCLLLSYPALIAQPTPESSSSTAQAEAAVDSMALSKRFGEIPESAQQHFFDDAPRPNGIRVAFYNVENLFDTYDDPIKRDDEFLPTGMKGWSGKRYRLKLNQIYRVLSAVGGWEPAGVIGLCELENRFVLEQLLEKTPLREFDYEIVHHESPDKRGIDVGLLYRPEKFKVLHEEALKVIFPFDTTSRTRDILYVKGQVLKRDTVHIFVNHWPSRFGGHLETDPKRDFVAQTIRDKADEVYAKDPKAKIIIMGDLNDAPQDNSVLNVLRTEHELEGLAQSENDLYNLMYEMSENWWAGTHKFQEHWGVLDQIIISPKLVKNPEGLLLKGGQAHIFKADWLMEEEELRIGDKPNRTYLGARYHGGFSDHLPVYIDLIYPDMDAE